MVEKIMDNKEKILDTALNLFYEKGYDATGVQEIVEATGITKPTLYHYFGSKQGLLDVILEQNNTALLNICKSACKYEHDLYWTLTKFAKAIFEFANKHKKFYSMQLSMWFAGEQSTGHISVSPYLFELHNIVEDLFEKASQDHGNLKGNQKIYAITFMGMINSYISVMQHANTEFNEQTIHKAIQQFMHGIFAL